MARPRVVISRCIGFGGCRYDGKEIQCPEIKELMDAVDLVPVCPELEMGLEVPREPLILVLSEEDLGLIQPATGRDLTELMARFSRTFLESLGEVDGFILKAESPSCAVRDARVFASPADEEPSTLGPGLFAREVMKRYPDIPVADDRDLVDSERRNSFLSSILG